MFINASKKALEGIDLEKHSFANVAEQVHPTVSSGSPPLHHSPVNMVLIFLQI